MVQCLYFTTSGENALLRKERVWSASRKTSADVHNLYDTTQKILETKPNMTNKDQKRYVLKKWVVTYTRLQNSTGSNLKPCHFHYASVPFCYQINCIACQLLLGNAHPVASARINARGKVVNW